MKYIPRLLEGTIRHHLDRGKSILLIGPRQTGKTTVLNRFESSLYVSLVTPSVRQRYEKNPAIFEKEVSSLESKEDKRPLVIVDEVQKVPALMDVAQALIDSSTAQFIITGSSARKLRRGGQINLLPGRVVALHLDPFVYREIPDGQLEDYLLYGALPGIHLDKNAADKETDLRSYVEMYLEEEVRAEALVRRIGSFSRFLEYAGLESGKVVSFRALSQQLGVSHTTIASYFEVLLDCLVAERVDPITESATRKKLMKSSRYLLFDLGVRRLCADEGVKQTPERMGDLFEQYVGLELIRNARLTGTAVVRYWRDPDGPEVDWVLEQDKEYIPVEVKWNDAPGDRESRHLKVFLSEYQQARNAYIVCRTPRRYSIDKRITAVPWQEIHTLLKTPEA